MITGVTLEGNCTGLWYWLVSLWKAIIWWSDHSGKPICLSYRL